MSCVADARARLLLAAETHLPVDEPRDRVTKAAASKHPLDTQSGHIGAHPHEDLQDERVHQHRGTVARAARWGLALASMKRPDEAVDEAEEDGRKHRRPRSLRKWKRSWSSESTR